MLADNLAMEAIERLPQGIIEHELEMEEVMRLEATLIFPQRGRDDAAQRR